MEIHADLLILTAVAALIAGRLFFVLGRRNDNDVPRPNPFTPPPPKAEETGPDEAFKGPKQAGEAGKPPLRLISTPPAAGSLAAGLAAIAALDAAFDEKAFLREARSNFTAIVEAYAADRLDQVSDRLSGPLLTQFQRAADLRRAEGQSATTRVRAIREAEVIEARADGVKAVITVKFLSEQENLLRDKSGDLIGGIEGRAEEVTDSWSFARDTTQAAEAPWIVIETRG